MIFLGILYLLKSLLVKIIMESGNQTPCWQKHYVMVTFMNSILGEFGLSFAAGISVISFFD